MCCQNPVHASAHKALPGGRHHASLQSYVHAASHNTVSLYPPLPYCSFRSTALCFVCYRTLSTQTRIRRCQIERHQVSLPSCVHAARYNSFSTCTGALLWLSINCSVLCVLQNPEHASTHIALSLAQVPGFTAGSCYFAASYHAASLRLIGPHCSVQLTVVCCVVTEP